MTFIIAITGPSGSGKSTLAKALLNEFGDRATFLPLDAYFKGRYWGCSLCTIPSDQFDHINFSNLTRRNYIYALVGNKFYYINSEKNQRTQLDISEVNLKKLKEELQTVSEEKALCCIENLSDIQLEFIHSITGHMHSNQSKEEYFRRNFDHPDALLLNTYADHIQSLFNGEIIKRPQVDFTNGTFYRDDDAVSVNPASILITEGIFTLHSPKIKRLVEESGISIYLNVPSPICMARVMKRDAQERHLPMETTIKYYPKKAYSGYVHFIKPLKNTCDLKVQGCQFDKNGFIESKSMDIILREILNKIVEKIPNHLIDELLEINSLGTLLRNLLEKKQNAMISNVSSKMLY